MPRALHYRPDIDGLRALAVLLVVASHLQVPHLAGGYVGVDVFFVISGFLITGIIVPEITAGTFTLRAFYERRLRRIAPALFVMLACTIPFARHFLLPTELAAYARSLVAAALACSNTIFWGWRGYFDTSNELKPLLHTWSLGVEEQFYLVFPLLLMLAARRNILRATILMIAALSFAATCFFVVHTPRVAFFAAPLRAWELMLGAVLSQANLRTSEKRGHRIQQEAAAVLGLALIVLPSMLYTDATAFPGLTALAPCLGAALLIATRGTWTHRVLMLRPAVFVGLISYSVYLWHWPLIVFTNLQRTWSCEGADCTASLPSDMRLALFVASLVCGAISWRFIEQPFRDRKMTSLGTVLAATSGLLVLLVGFTTHTLRSGGEPQRFPAKAVFAASYLDFDTHSPWRWSSCALALDESPALFDKGACLPYTAGHKHYLLLGDSHAAQLWPGLHKVFPELEIGQLNVAGCNLLPYKQHDAVPTCRAMAQYVYGTLLANGRVDTLIVSAQWHDDDLAYVTELLQYARAHHIEVLLLGPNAAVTLSAPRLLARLETRQRPGDMQRFTELPEAQLDLRMASLAQHEWHVPYVSFFSESCSGMMNCLTYTSTGEPIFLDRHHLTPAGATMVAQALRDRHRLP